MADSDIVEIDIVIANSGPSRAGFGLPLMVTHDAPWPDLIRLYEDSGDAVDDGFAEDSPVVRGLSKIFSQTPKPPLVAVGRVTAAVTQRYEIVIVDAVEKPYTIAVAGEGFEDDELTLTPDPGDDEGDIAADFVTLLNAVTDKNYTAAVDGTDPNMIIVTGNAPSDWFSLSVGNPHTGLMSIRQTHTVANIGTDLDAIRNVNDAWYVVLTHFNSKDYVEDVAEWCTANGKVYPFDTVDSDVIDEAFAVDGDDVGAELLAFNYSYVSGAYHHTPAEFFAHAWMGRWLPTIPGQTNPAWRTLEGVTPTLLNATQKTNLLARRMNYYRHAFGQSFTWEGTVFSTVYKYIDVRRNADWLQNTMLTNIVGRLVGSEGVGFDQPGIQVIAGGAEAALAEGTDQGVLAASPKYVIEVPLAETIPTNDKGERALKKLKWSGQLRGFINKVVPVKGTLTF